jgi:hypothetical protein
MQEFIKEAIQFVMMRKKYWMIPIFIVFTLLAALIVLGQGSTMAPFIYTIF